MDLFAHCSLEVRICDLAILVVVKEFIDLVEGCLLDMYAPMIKVDFEFIRLNSPTLVFAQVVKGLSDRLPLKLDLVKHGLNHIFLSDHVFRDHILESTYCICILCSVVLI